MPLSQKNKKQSKMENKQKQFLSKCRKLNVPSIRYLRNVLKNFKIRITYFFRTPRLGSGSMSSLTPNRKGQHVCTIQRWTSFSTDKIFMLLPKIVFCFIFSCLSPNETRAINRGEMGRNTKGGNQNFQMSRIYFKNWTHLYPNDLPLRSSKYQNVE